VSVGVWIDVGSRHEKPFENGFSHFIEHMLFKGTERRSARQLAGAIESLGGSVNAFTSRQHTCYAVRILDDYLTEAVDVLADMVCHSRFTPTNIGREKRVILEEIKEADDMPSDRIHDLFSEAYWGEHPLAYPIEGRPETVSSLTRGKLLAFMQRHYRAESIVVVATGSVSHRKLCQLVTEHMVVEGGKAEASPLAQRINFRPFDIREDDHNQVNLCLGFPGLAFNDADRPKAILLSTYLGGGMSSVIFQKVREEKGLAYNVSTFMDHYTDAGIIGAYLGTDRTRVRQALELILTELRRVKRRKIASTSLDEVKRLIRGQVLLSLESTSSRMRRLARQELMAGEPMEIKTLLRQLDRVTVVEVMDMANRLFDESAMTVAVLGPMSEKEFHSSAA
jgi:predicted Zn-dependent peptidase